VSRSSQPTCFQIAGGFLDELFIDQDIMRLTLLYLLLRLRLQRGQMCHLRGQGHRHQSIQDELEVGPPYSNYTMVSLRIHPCFLCDPREALVGHLLERPSFTFTIISTLVPRQCRNVSNMLSSLSPSCFLVCARSNNFQPMLHFHLP
jgi:hypothetical protein